MDDLSATSRVQRIVFMKGAQTGGTESGNNWLGYVMHHVPAPMMVVQPTVDLAKRFSRQRVDPLVTETPALADKVTPPRKGDGGNTVLSKEFPGGILVMTGANSAVGLRSMPARFLFLDEVDAYDQDVDDEGDPIGLAEARSRTFGWRRKAFLVSTPTIAGRSRIEAEYLKSDQRRYFVPCPYCQHSQWLRFERLVWPKGAPQEAAYQCEGCDRYILEHHKTRMLEAGEWRATATAEDPFTVGYHISALYSPVGWMSWAEIAREWEDAQGKPEDLKTFKNTVLGETWMETGDAPDWERLIERSEDYHMGEVPERGMVLTAGVDVQPDRLECDIWAWAEGNESWLVDHLVFPGSPREPKVWDTMYGEVLAKGFPRIDGGFMQVSKVCVDTGGSDTAAVYGQLRRLRDPRIAPTKGVDSWDRAQPVAGPTMVDAQLNGRKIRRGLRLWTVAVSMWKVDLYRRLWLTRTDAEVYPPGWVHVPKGVGSEWVKQLVAEQLRTIRNKRTGRQKQEWAKLRDRNEALDCAILARAALYLLGADRYGARYWERLMAERSDEKVLKPPPEVLAPPAEDPPEAPPEEAPPSVDEAPIVPSPEAVLNKRAAAAPARTRNTGWLGKRPGGWLRR